MTSYFPNILGKSNVSSLLNYHKRALLYAAEGCWHLFFSGIQLQRVTRGQMDAEKALIHTFPWLLRHSQPVGRCGEADRAALGWAAWQSCLLGTGWTKRENCISPISPGCSASCLYCAQILGQTAKHSLEQTLHSRANLEALLFSS